MHKHAWAVFLRSGGYMFIAVSPSLPVPVAPWVACVGNAMIAIAYGLDGP